MLVERGAVGHARATLRFSAKEVVEAIGYLAYSEWTTGAILDVEGGVGLGELQF